MSRFGWFSKERIHERRTRFHDWTEKVFSDSRKTFAVLAIFTFTVLFLIQTTIILFSNGFYNGGSDDVCQYYPIVNDFFNKIKDGTLSWFNLNNYFGASYFSDAYYIPLDVFTLVAFLFSYIMPFAIAFSSAELVKLFAGVMILGYFLHKEGYKNKTVFWMSVIYIVSGGMACFTAFPGFYSLVFYLPASLMVIHWFQKGKAWVVPLFVVALVLYNFYSAFMALSFMAIMFVIQTLKTSPFRFGKFLTDGLAFLGLILLGVGMSAVYFLPTVQFILEDTYRGTSEFIGWTVKIWNWEVELFKPEIYIRILAKTFTEQRAAGFVGFLDDYRYEHTSLYITVIGLAIMSYVIFMKDKVSWIYKGVMVVFTIMMIFPFFSYVMSGTQYIVDVPYTRWIDMLPLVEILILAHVFDRCGFEGIKMKWLTIPLILMLATVGYLLYYYYGKIEAGELGRGKEALIAEAYFLGIAAVYLILTLIFGWMGKLKWVLGVFVVEFILGLGYIYVVSYALTNRITFFDDMESINEFLNDNIEQDEFYRVYVDVDRFDVQVENFNRMTTFWTNTKKIFHSWTDAETNRISAILFDEEEYQEKDAMMVFNMYLDHVLGYKYLLLNADYDYNLPSAYFTLVAEEGIYQLYEIQKAEPFQVYESYLMAVQFDILCTPTPIDEFLSQEKLIENVLFDDLHNEDLILPNLALGTYIDKSALSNETVNAYSRTANPSVVDVAGLKDETVREFYRYDAADMNINYSSGAIWFRISVPEDYVNLEAYVVLESGREESCQLTYDGSYVEAKCPESQFFSEPVYFYFERSLDYWPTARKLDFRMEQAFGASSYIVINLPDDMPTSGLMYLSFTKPLEKAFVVDAEGNQSSFLSGTCYFDTQPVRLYVLKTYEMDTYGEFNLRATFFSTDLDYFDEQADSDLAADEMMTIENGKITLSYTRTSSSSYDQVVMIPVTYSEEWVITSDVQYRTMSVSGGFLGIVIPNGVTDISITLEFVPKGLATGARISGGALAGYAVIFGMLGLIRYQKKKKRHSCEDGEESIQ